MASIRVIVEGLLIISKTAEVPAGLAAKGCVDGMEGNCAAEHDIIFAPDCDPSVEDQAKLESLGWHWSTECNCWARFT